MKILKYILALSMSFILIGIFTFTINKIVSIFTYSIFKYSIYLFLIMLIAFIITIYKKMFYAKYLLFLLLVFSFDIYLDSNFDLEVNYDTTYKKYILLFTIISFVGAYTLFTISYFKNKQK